MDPTLGQGFSYQKDDAHHLPYSKDSSKFPVKKRNLPKKHIHKHSSSKTHKIFKKTESSIGERIEPILHNRFKSHINAASKLLGPNNIGPYSLDSSEPIDTRMYVKTIQLIGRIDELLTQSMSFLPMSSTLSNDATLLIMKRARLQLKASDFIDNLNEIVKQWEEKIRNVEDEIQLMSESKDSSKAKLSKLNNVLERYRKTKSQFSQVGIKQIIEYLELTNHTMLSFENILDSITQRFNDIEDSYVQQLNKGLSIDLSKEYYEFTSQLSWSRHQKLEDLSKILKLLYHIRTNQNTPYQNAQIILLQINIKLAIGDQPHAEITWFFNEIKCDYISIGDITDTDLDVLINASIETGKENELILLCESLLESDYPKCDLGRVRAHLASLFLEQLREQESLSRRNHVLDQLIGLLKQEEIDSQFYPAIATRVFQACILVDTTPPHLFEGSEETLQAIIVRMMADLDNFEEKEQTKILSFINTFEGVTAPILHSVFKTAAAEGRYALAIDAAHRLQQLSYPFTKDDILQIYCSLLIMKNALGKEEAQRASELWPEMATGTLDPATVELFAKEKQDYVLLYALLKEISKHTELTQDQRLFVCNQALARNDLPFLASFLESTIDKEILTSPEKLLSTIKSMDSSKIPELVELISSLGIVYSMLADEIEGSLERVVNISSVLRDERIKSIFKTELPASESSLSNLYEEACVRIGIASLEAIYRLNGASKFTEFLEQLYREFPDNKLLNTYLENVYKSLPDPAAVSKLEKLDEDRSIRQYQKKLALEKLFIGDTTPLDSLTAKEQEGIECLKRTFEKKATSEDKLIVQAFLDYLIGKDMRLVSRIAKFKTDEKDGILSAFANILQTLAFKSQLSNLEKCQKQVARLESLLSKIELGEEIKETDQFSIQDYKIIRSYCNLYYELETLRETLSKESVPMPENMQKLHLLMSTCLKLIDRLNTKLDHSKYPTGTVFFHHDTRKTKLLSSSKVYNREYLKKLWNQGMYSELKDTTKSFVKDLSSFNLWAIQPLFTGAYKHATLVFNELQDQVHLSSAMQSFYYLAADIDSYLMSDYYAVDISKQLTPEAIDLFAKVGILAEQLAKETNRFYQEELTRLLEENRMWFEKEGHMDVSVIRAASSALSMASRDVEQRSLDWLHRISNGRIPVEGMRYNLPFDSILKKKKTPLKDRREQGVPLRHTEIFCSEFVSRMMAQAGYNTDKRLKQDLIEEGISEESLKGIILVNSLIPEACKFKSIHPDYLKQLISGFATKLPYPEIIKKVFKPSELY